MSLGRFSSGDHSGYFVARVYKLHGCAWVTFGKNSEDLVSECLANLMNVLEVKDNPPESIDAQQ